MQEMDEMRLAVGETEALAAMLLLFFEETWGWIKRENWRRCASFSKG